MNIAEPQQIQIDLLALRRVRSSAPSKNYPKNVVHQVYTGCSKKHYGLLPFKSCLTAHVKAKECVQ
jgi:hypothetical protein